jgi:hypothetical protein
MESNPYSSPSANLFGPSSASSGEAVSAGAVTMLKRTKPWVRLAAVMSFLSAALMIGLAAMMILGGGAIAAALANAPTASGEALPAGMLAGLGVVYGLMSFLYIYPGMKLWGYANFIARLMVTPSAENLEAALNQQRAFWKYVGIWIIIGLCFMALGVAMSVIGALVAVSSGAAAQ